MSANTHLNVLLLGSGGRESALARAIAGSPRLGKLFIAPGNGGTGAYGTNLPLPPMISPPLPEPWPTTPSIWWS